MYRRASFVTAAVAVLGTGTATAFASSPSNPGDSHSMNFVDVDIRRLAEAVSAATGKQMLIHPQVQGRVTLTSKRALSAPEIYAAFGWALSVQGYVVEESRGVVKVYPSRGRD